MLRYPGRELRSQGESSSGMTKEGPDGNIIICELKTKSRFFVVYEDQRNDITPRARVSELYA